MNARATTTWVNAFGDSAPRLVPLEIHDQFQAYISASRRYSHSFLFESLTGPGKLAETSVMGFDPVRVVRGYPDRLEITHRDKSNQTRKCDDPLSELESMLGRNEDSSYRYLGGAVGSVDYRAAGLFEQIPDSRKESGPIFEFGIYDDGLLYDNALDKSFYFYYNQDRSDQFLNDGELGKFSASEAVSETDADSYIDAVKKAKGYVHDGDVFQVVLSRRFAFRASGDDLHLYSKLRELNPSPYMYHLKHGQKRIVGASPEMLVRVSNNKVETFPIAGTRKVTGDPAKDSKLADELLADEKERAEHTMLVDLGRNDVGRVCRYGTVKPEESFVIRRFSHVQHIVSHISGELAPGRSMFDAFRSVFPAGTVSGAPKVRAMEIIDELESGPRGGYAGAVGYFGFNGCCDFAIAIRSIFIDGELGYVQAGAGIVSDSVPEKELQETQDKAGAMVQALKEASV